MATLGQQAVANPSVKIWALSVFNADRRGRVTNFWRVAGATAQWRAPLAARVVVRKGSHTSAEALAARVAVRHWLAH